MRSKAPVRGNMSDPFSIVFMLNQPNIPSTIGLVVVQNKFMNIHCLVGNQRGSAESDGLNET